MHRSYIYLKSPCERKVPIFGTKAKGKRRARFHHRPVQHERVRVKVGDEEIKHYLHGGFRGEEQAYVEGGQVAQYDVQDGDDDGQQQIVDEESDGHHEDKEAACIQGDRAARRCIVGVVAVVIDVSVVVELCVVAVSAIIFIVIIGGGGTTQLRRKRHHQLGAEWLLHTALGLVGELEFLFIQKGVAGHHSQGF